MPAIQRFPLLPSALVAQRLLAAGAVLLLVAADARSAELQFRKIFEERTDKIPAHPNLPATDPPWLARSINFQPAINNRDEVVFWADASTTAVNTVLIAGKAGSLAKTILLRRQEDGAFTAGEFYARGGSEPGYYEYPFDDLGGALRVIRVAMDPNPRINGTKRALAYVSTSDPFGVANPNAILLATEGELGPDNTPYPIADVISHAPWHHSNGTKAAFTLLLDPGASGQHGVWTYDIPNKRIKQLLLPGQPVPGRPGASVHSAFAVALTYLGDVLLAVQDALTGHALLVLFKYDGTSCVLAEEEQPSNQGPLGVLNWARATTVNNRREGIFFCDFPPPSPPAPQISKGFLFPFRDCERFDSWVGTGTSVPGAPGPIFALQAWFNDNNLLPYDASHVVNDFVSHFTAYSRLPATGLGDHVLIAKPDDPAPDLPEGVLLDRTSIATVNNRDQVLILATLKGAGVVDGTNHRALYLFEPGEPLRLIMRLSTPVATNIGPRVPTGDSFFPSGLGSSYGTQGCRIFNDNGVLVVLLRNPETNFDGIFTVNLGPASPEPTLSVADLSIREGRLRARKARFIVSLSEPLDVDVTVHVKTADGTAMSGSDYLPTSFTLTIPRGATTAPVDVDIQPDGKLDGLLGDVPIKKDETFSLVLNNAVNATIADDTGVCTIIDDELDPTAPAETAANKEQSGTTSDPINTSTGELVALLPPDLDLGGPLPLVFRRHYASWLTRDDRSPGRLGANWLHNFEWVLFDRTTTVEVVDARGRVIEFNRAGGAFELAGTSDIPFQLAADGANFVLGDPRTQLFHRFDATGKLVAIADGRGNTLTLDYTNSLLSSVSDGLGRMLTFTHDGGGSLVSVSDSTRNVQFTHDTLDLLTCTDTRGFTTTYHYDPANPFSGMLIKSMHPEGNVPFSQTYDAQGRVVSQTEAGAHVTTLSYAGALTTITDPLGHTQKHSHDTGGRLTTVADEANQNIVMTYNIAGQRASVTNRRSDTASTAYHAASGNVSSATNFDGTVTSFTYTSRIVDGITFHDLSSVTFPDGTTESFTRDANGNVLTRTDRAGKVTTFTSNARGQVLTATNPAGGVTTLTYNADGTLASRTDSDTGVTTFAYDALRRLTVITHPDATTITIAYDAADQITSVTDERNNPTTYDYDDNGNLVRVTDPAANVTQFAYDARDRVASITDRLGAITMLAYTARGQFSRVTDRNGNAVEFSYDARRRLSALLDAGSKTWGFAYDVEAELVSASNPLSQTTQFARNRAGALAGFTSALGHETELIRDAMQRVTEVIDPLARMAGYTYDARGLLAAADLPLVGSATYTYNDLGRLRRVTGLDGEVWQFDHTSMGRLAKVTDPLGRTAEHSYDDRGRTARIAYANGVMVDQTYDAAGNVTRRLYSGASGPDLNFSYDALNRLGAANELAFTYDAEGRITNTVSSGANFGASYDAGGRLTSVTYLDGALAVTYTYDVRDRVTRVSDTLTGTQIDFTYDDAGRLTGITRPNGVNTTFTYDAAGRRTRIQEGTIIDLAYTLNAADEITQVEFTAPLDPASVIGAASTTTNWTYDAALQINNTGYAYDARGRLTSSPGHTFTWNGASRLTAIDSVALAYDGLGNLITRTAGGVTTRFHYNHAIGLAPIAIERNETTGQVVRHYVWTPGGRLLYLIDAQAGNAVRHFHFDRVGSTLALTDAAGAVTDAYAYTPYGEVLSYTGTSTQPFLYVGAFGVRHEPTANLHHMRARYYDPVSARFLSRDPLWPQIADPRLLDPYQYALGAPDRFSDPTGLTPTPTDAKTLVNPTAPANVSEVVTTPTRRLPVAELIDLLDAGDLTDREVIDLIDTILPAADDFSLTDYEDLVDYREEILEPGIGAFVLSHFLDFLGQLLEPRIPIIDPPDLTSPQTTPLSPVASDSVLSVFDWEVTEDGQRRFRGTGRSIP